MTTEEFSNAFDTLINSYNNISEHGETHSSADIVLDEYEKSLFLTEAQNQIVIELYSGRNTKGASFEETEELRSHLRNLIKSDVLTPSSGELGLSTGKSRFFKLPIDVLFITYESAIIDDKDAGCKNGSVISVQPVTQDEFYRVSNNPFRGPNERRALRLDSGKDVVEIVSKYNISAYIIRYLSKPKPIVLTDLSEMGAFPEVEGKVTECKLDSILHESILDRAVLLALQSKGISNKK